MNLRKKLYKAGWIVTIAEMGEVYGTFLKAYSSPEKTTKFPLYPINPYAELALGLAGFYSSFFSYLAFSKNNILRKKSLKSSLLESIGTSLAVSNSIFGFTNYVSLALERIFYRALNPNQLISINSIGEANFEMAFFTSILP